MKTICHKTCEENEDIVKSFLSKNLISVSKRNKNKLLYLSVEVFSTAILIVDTETSKEIL